jgi:RNA polymerase sigma-70 factor, ECF subfamily
MQTKKCIDKSDEELVALTLQDQEYFLVLMNRYEKKLMSYIIRISGMKYEDAEDILQDVFVKIYYNLNNFDPKLKFSSWIYRIAHNQTISEFRKRKARPVQYFQEEDLVRFVDNFEIDKSIDNILLRESMEKIFSKMDKKYRDVLVLKFLEEKDYNEISDILKKPVGTIGTLINRGKKKFKKEFDKSK